MQHKNTAYTAPLCLSVWCSLFAGDVIAIASSSFFGEEVDEVAITGVTPGADGNTTLALARPLVYTHLGEVVTVPGDTRGHRLDMRAEVAVLNRWVGHGEG